jgi:hypothetical protein
VTEFFVSLVPSLGVLFLLWVSLRAILQADRRERVAKARLDAEHESSPVEGRPGTAGEARQARASTGSPMGGGSASHGGSVEKGGSVAGGGAPTDADGITG